MTSFFAHSEFRLGRAVVCNRPELTGKTGTCSVPLSAASEEDSRLWTDECYVCTSTLGRRGEADCPALTSLALSTWARGVAWGEADFCLWRSSVCAWLPLPLGMMSLKTELFSDLYSPARGEWCCGDPACPNVSWLRALFLPAPDPDVPRVPGGAPSLLVLWLPTLKTGI